MCTLLSKTATPPLEEEEEDGASRGMLSRALNEELTVIKDDRNV
jgi:hypothetical protein